MLKQKYELSSPFALDGSEVAQSIDTDENNFFEDEPFEGDLTREPEYFLRMQGQGRGRHARIL